MTQPTRLDLTRPTVPTRQRRARIRARAVANRSPIKFGTRQRAGGGAGGGGGGNGSDRLRPLGLSRRVSLPLLMPPWRDLRGRRSFLTFGR